MEQALQIVQHYFELVIEWAVILCDVIGVVMIVLTAIYGAKCPQWLWAVAGGVLLHAVTLCCMGVHGMYLGRMYDELKDRPLYIVAETLNAGDN